MSGYRGPTDPVEPTTPELRLSQTINGWKRIARQNRDNAAAGSEKSRYWSMYARVCRDLQERIERELLPETEQDQRQGRMPKWEERRA